MLIFHHFFTKNKLLKQKVEFRCNNLLNHDELILSWNAKRPKKGFYSIKIAYFCKKWTTAHCYAVWDVNHQYTFSLNTNIYTCHQDLISFKQKISRFKVIIEAKRGANLNNFYSISALWTNSCEILDKQMATTKALIEMSVPKISQKQFKSPIIHRICSPTSCACVLQFINNNLVNPIHFAKKVYDKKFDIYGNWVLNVAEVSHYLGPNWLCFVTRLKSIQDLITHLKYKIPIIVSVKGELKGAEHSYPNGHLLVIRGIDTENNRILCMDPAFSNPEQTYITYDLSDFMNAWEKRNGLAYLFKPTCPLT